MRHRRLRLAGTLIAPYNPARIVEMTAAKAVVFREPLPIAQRLEHDLFWSKFQ